MEVKKTVCDVCGIELPVINKWHRSTTRIKAKIKKINDECDYCGLKIIKLDLCEQCLYNLCTNYSTRMESDEELLKGEQEQNEKYDYSKSVWENIKEGNGISKEIPKRGKWESGVRLE